MKHVLDMTEEEFSTAYPAVDKVRRWMRIPWLEYREKYLLKANYRALEDGALPTVIERTALPTRRESINVTVKNQGQRVHLGLGFYDHAKTRVGELFILVSKTGSRERMLWNEIGIGASKRLQLGESLESVCEDWLGTRVEPAGPVTGDEHIKFCTSILDFVAKYLMFHYCGRTDVVHVKGEGL